MMLPNHLSPELLNLFVTLSNDQNKLVRHRFMNYTLPQIVAQHLNLLQSHLRYMTRYVDLDWPIAASISIAYRLAPKDVMRVLASWHNEAINSHPTQPINPKRVTLRETLIATVALTYGELDYDLPGGPLSADEGFKRLQMILKDETHPFVRTAAVIAITNQARRNFTQVAPALQECLIDVAIHEREEIVKILVEFYDEQRGSLPNGSDRVIINERRYPIWQPLEARPLTEIEHILLTWIKDDRFPIAQQIAVRSLIAFEGAIDKPIRERALQQQEERQRAEADEVSASPNTALTSTTQLNNQWYQHRFVPWVVTLGKPNYQAIIRALLPEILLRKKDDTPSTQVVLKRLGDSSDEFLVQVSRRLQRAITMVENGCLFQFLIAIAVLFSLCIMLQILQSLANTLSGR